MKPKWPTSIFECARQTHSRLSAGADPGIFDWGGPNWFRKDR